MNDEPHLRDLAARYLRLTEQIHAARYADSAALARLLAAQQQAAARLVQRAGLDPAAADLERYCRTLIAET
ncbi:MAG: hypothetical protein MI924_06105 [Chloroflexales bacterium]|nr:hypothetical protein [Chloroflexales bacterium]